MSRSENAPLPEPPHIDIRPQKGEPFRLSISIGPVDDEDLGGHWNLRVVPTDHCGYAFGDAYPDVTFALEQLDDFIMHLVERAFPGVGGHYR